jgi:antitoxin VapB
MPLNIRSRVVNQLAERLAAGRQTSKTDAVRIALENELRRLDEAVPLRDRLRRRRATARDAGIRRNSTLATALLTQWQRTLGRHCCSRATISTRPTSAPPRSRAEI